MANDKDAKLKILDETIAGIEKAFGKGRYS